MKSERTRVWEVDFFRGVALILMVIFHLVFDLNEIYGLSIEYDSGIFYYVGKAAAVLFIIISGISCTLSKTNVKRGIKILAIAMGLTIVTHLYDTNMGIKFGILHFLGLCIFLYPLFKSINKYWLIIAGTLVIIAGNLISGIIVKPQLLFPIGLTSSGFTSLDYYPLFPWMGLFLYGIGLGKILYVEQKSLFKFSIGENIVSFMGRHTLIIYLCHQPIIILILGILKQLY